MRRVAAVSVALAAIGVAVVVAIVLLGSSSGRPVAAPASALTVRTAIAPGPVFFGDRVIARVDVVVDPQRVDPDDVQLGADFTPFALAASPRRWRFDEDDLTLLGYRFVLECLSDQCLPGADPRKVPLPVLRVRAGGAVTVARWPAVEIVPRVARSEAADAPTPWRLQLALPDVSYRSAVLRPAVVAALAAAFAVAALWLAAWELERRRRRLRELALARTRLEQALELVRESLGRGADDRRKALDALARELDGDGRHAFAATRLAWARAEPSVPNVEGLLAEIEAAR